MVGVCVCFIYLVYALKTCTEILESYCIPSSPTPSLRFSDGDEAVDELDLDQYLPSSPPDVTVKHVLFAKMGASRFGEGR